MSEEAGANDMENGAGVWSGVLPGPFSDPGRQCHNTLEGDITEHIVMGSRRICYINYSTT